MLDSIYLSQKIILLLETLVIFEAIILVGFSSLFTLSIAYFLFRFKEGKQEDKVRIKAINAILTVAHEYYATLITRKETYYKELTSNEPISRFSVITPLPFNEAPITHTQDNLAALSFIIPLKKDKPEEINSKWRQLSAISSLLVNYTSVMRIWLERDNLTMEIMEDIYDDIGLPEITEESILESKNKLKFLRAVRLTEQAIQFTDNLIIEFYDFMKKLPEIGNHLIPKESREIYGVLMSLDKKRTPTKMLKKVPEVNQKRLIELLSNINTTNLKAEK